MWRLRGRLARPTEGEFREIGWVVVMAARVGARRSRGGTGKCAGRGDQGVGAAGGPVASRLMDVAGSEESIAEDVGGLTPRQARRIRIILASVVMAAMAAVLVVRLASRTSVLVVGVYGAALVLCGVVIELSRHGRTRLGTWLLGVGLVAALAADWLLLP
ncbi:hypothetical protein [Streptomyces sp. NPDC048644]|uniref:hypothetical protein n=1 Tax=Streptomyces sp. NPDC048644 TaxID=3365582 RepID=UPI003715F564